MGGDTARLRAALEAAAGWYRAGLVANRPAAVVVAAGLAAVARSDSGAAGAWRGRWGSGVVDVFRHRLVVPLVDGGGGVGVDAHADAVRDVAGLVTAAPAAARARLVGLVAGRLGLPVDLVTAALLDATAST